MSATLPTVRLRSGTRIPVLGHGAYRRPADSAQRKQMIAAVRTGIDLGLTVVATDLDSEELVGEAIVRRRQEVFLVARVPAAEATVDGMAAACAASLRRLGVDAVDLYLVHGRGRIPLQETVEGFGALEDAGLIRNWGVADFALPALAELFTLTAGCAADEVVFDLSHRGSEWDLLDGCHDRGVALLAACSLDVRGHRRLHALAERHGVTPAQLELAWLTSHEGVVALPPPESPAQTEEYRAAVELRLDGHDHAWLDDAYPPPLGPQPLEPRELSLARA